MVNFVRNHIRIWYFGDYGDASIPKRHSIVLDIKECYSVATHSILIRI